MPKEAMIYRSTLTFEEYRRPKEKGYRSCCCSRMAVNQRLVNEALNGSTTRDAGRGNRESGIGTRDSRLGTSGFTTSTSYTASHACWSPCPKHFFNYFRSQVYLAAFAAASEFVQAGSRAARPVGRSRPAARDQDSSSSARQSSLSAGRGAFACGSFVMRSIARLGASRGGPRISRAEAAREWPVAPMRLRNPRHVLEHRHACGRGRAENDGHRDVPLRSAAAEAAEINRSRRSSLVQPRSHGRAADATR